MPSLSEASASSAGIDAYQTACYGRISGMLKCFPVAVSPGFDRRTLFSHAESNQRGVARVYPAMGALSHG